MTSYATSNDFFCIFLISHDNKGDDTYDESDPPVNAGTALEETKMKVGKSFAFAQLVERLLKGESIDKATFVSSFDITDDQFHRYIAGSKKYMDLFHPEYEVAFLKSDNIYVLRRRKANINPIR